MKKIIALIILLLIALLLFFFLCNKKKEIIPQFTLQGQTEIGQGPVLMNIWDHEAEDGDTIQVYFDGKMIRDTLGILNIPIELPLGKLSKGEHLIGVKAINEGSSAPASAYISLNDGTTEKEFSMDAWIDSAASWKVVIK